MNNKKNADFKIETMLMIIAIGVARVLLTELVKKQFVLTELVLKPFVIPVFKKGTTAAD